MEDAASLTGKMLGEQGYAPLPVQREERVKL